MGSFGRHGGEYQRGTCLLGGLPVVAREAASDKEPAAVGAAASPSQKEERLAHVSAWHLA